MALLGSTDGGGGHCHCWALVGGTAGHRWVALLDDGHRWVALLGTGGRHCWAQVSGTARH
ncbi:unnamed protein product [Staurois parvus]|uniref:Uncharacterized protein n=1 Tax=Staurois parvus TaxID=386267 RepID=A0ABN9D3S3_9NEOB|nr:unnamed protein product [Staurois parvus]